MEESEDNDGMRGVVWTWAKPELRLKIQCTGRFEGSFVKDICHAHYHQGPTPSSQYVSDRRRENGTGVAKTQKNACPALCHLGNVDAPPLS